MNSNWLVAFVAGFFLAWSSPAFAQEVYEVKRGDTLAEIAATFGVSVADLKAANGLSPGRAGDLIHPRQRLVIPGRSGSASTDGLPTPTRTYTVVPGDSLAAIGARFGCDPEWLRDRNGIVGDLIFPGQVLVVPGIAPASATVPASSTVPASHGRAPASDASATAAVHAPINASATDLEVLARIVKGECPETVPFEGQVAVAAVVLNRVRSSRFPNTIPGVAHQPLQFSCYNRNVRNRLYWGHVPQYAWDAARAALRGEDPSLGSTYYFNPYLVRPSWARRLEFVRRIGRGVTNAHDFYRERGSWPPASTPHSGLAGRLR